MVALPAGNARGGTVTMPPTEPPIERPPERPPEPPTERPTICFLTGTLNAFAGAERMTAVIANGLAERGYRVCVLSLYDSTSAFPLHEDVTHHALFDARPSYKRAYLATVLGIRRFVQAHAIDVLVEVDPMLTLFTLPATLGLGVRRVAWEHCHFDEDLGRPARRVARWMAARTNDAIVVLTERDRQRWQQRLRPRQLRCIGNTLPFAYPGHPASGDAKRVLAVGRLVPVKGFDTLLAAWAEVARVHPDWQLVIVGEGELRDALARQIDDLRITPFVTLAGATHNVESFYRSASVFCLTSHYEGFGMVLIEAMAYGLAIVSSNCEAGPRELVTADENGILVSPGDTDAIARGLCRVIEDPSLRESLARNGRRMAHHYALPPTLDAWQDLLAGI